MGKSHCSFVFSFYFTAARDIPVKEAKLQADRVSRPRATPITARCVGNTRSRAAKWRLCILSSAQQRPLPGERRDFISILQVLQFQVFLNEHK